MNGMAVENQCPGITALAVTSGTTSSNTSGRCNCIAVSWNDAQCASLLRSCWLDSLSGCSLSSAISVEQLCDELLDHMLDCDMCLGGGETPCAIQQGFQRQIVVQGGAKTGVVFAF